MSYKKQILIIIVFSVLTVLLGFSANTDIPLRLNLCHEATPGWIDDNRKVHLSDVPEDYCGRFASNFVPSLILSGLSIFLVSVTLLFVRDYTYLSWRRFARWAIPIGAIILFLVPADSPGGWISGPDLTKETASWGVSIAFLLISLIIIVRKSLQKKNK